MVFLHTNSYRTGIREAFVCLRVEGGARLIVIPVLPGFGRNQKCTASEAFPTPPKTRFTRNLARKSVLTLFPDGLFSGQEIL